MSEFQQTYTTRLAANVDHIVAKQERLEALYNLEQMRLPAVDEPAHPKVKSARSQNRASAWAYDLETWRDFRLAHATCDLERERIERDYDELAVRGPDFLHHRPGAVVCGAPPNRLAKGAKDAALTCWDRVADWDWHRRRKKKSHGQSVSSIYRRILAVLYDLAEEHGGFVYPSLMTIANKARCCVRTVVNGLRWLKLWGFLDWLRRLKRRVNALGQAVLMPTSNGYTLPRTLEAIGAKVWGRGVWQQVSNITSGEANRPTNGSLFAREETGVG